MSRRFGTPIRRWYRGNGSYQVPRRGGDEPGSVFPQVRIGEAYVDGTMTIEKGTLKDFLYVVGHNLVVQQDGVLQRIGRRFQNVVNLAATYNPVGKAQKNVAHHYDLNGEFFELFLDSDKQYSCAYFETPDTDLETAQVAKKAHVAKKLRIEPGMKVLDIGSGWGGLGLYLAQNYDCDVTGVTLSVEQHKVSNQRARTPVSTIVCVSN